MARTFIVAPQDCEWSKQYNVGAEALREGNRLSERFPNRNDVVRFSLRSLALLLATNEAEPAQQTCPTDAGEWHLSSVTSSGGHTDSTASFRFASFIPYGASQPYDAIRGRTAELALSHCQG